MEQPLIPILDLPINSVLCIGRNYADHAKELGNTAPKEPLLFLKANNCISINPNEISLPTNSNDVHHEIELVVAIKKAGYRIPTETALEHIGAYAVGIDLTARDLQNQDKSSGKPWTRAKSFYQSAILSDWASFDRTKTDLQDLNLHLKVNGDTRQYGSTQDMIFDIQTLISDISHRFPLIAGDIIYTGTPAGVSALKTNDHIQAVIEDHPCTLDFKIR